MNLTVIVGRFLIECFSQNNVDQECETTADAAITRNVAICGGPSLPDLVPSLIAQLAKYRIVDCLAAAVRKSRVHESKVGAIHKVLALMLLIRGKEALKTGGAQIELEGLHLVL